MKDERDKYSGIHGRNTSCRAVIANFIVGGISGLFIGGALGFASCLLLLKIAELRSPSGYINLDGATGMGGGSIVIGSIIGGIIGAIKGVNRTLR